METTRPFLSDIKSLLKNSIHVKEIKAKNLSDQFHFHNGFEIATIFKGNGRRIVGDNMEYFTDGDLTILGPNLPHATYSEKKYHVKESESDVHAVVVYFQPDWIVESHMNSADFAPLKALLKGMNRGVAIKGDLHRKLMPLLYQLKDTQGMESFLLLLKILCQVSQSQEYDYLASPGYSNTYDENSIKKIHQVYQYVMENFTGRISLDEVASLAHMTPPAFCRFFKNKTNKTFTSFVNEIRIGHACELLINENLDISQICFACGFNNFTSFNKSFKQFTKRTPSEYRMEIPKLLYSKKR
ncbi:AraC family transcriptional regulator [Parapedobacter sp. 10938]|uniref:AraC family transcriptional regulator n=1 Tax=Parapedobacter flavus TaxID=3110225 RepID=UPI002DB8DAEC|nr:AraC family transcriptional regulator [Parapedobacter sp. 10938]MEC3878443.1 AraC family transcriptional regulator [Parapedobacter sp. 10938]